ncbi:uncharacterized protein [Bos indicus]|uniref:Collagen alpha-1(I) chain-like n=1 Tax=Bos indicus TaxID=9915 RepID=A0ABM4SZE2_BOSIN
MQAPGAKRAGESYSPRPRREDRRGARGSGAGSSPAAALSSRVLPLPRQPQHRAGGNRRTVARLSGGPGRRQSPRPGGGPARNPRRPAARALPTAPGAGSSATAPSASGVGGKLLSRQRLWPPPSAPRKVRGSEVQREPLGPGVPGRARLERGRAPTFPAGGTPAARPPRASRTGKSPREGPGKAAGGFGRGMSHQVSIWRWQNKKTERMDPS